MYIETSSNNKGEGVFVVWERTDLIHIVILHFIIIRFSTSNTEDYRRMGRFRIQF